MQLQYGRWPLRHCKTPVGVVVRRAIRASVVLPSNPQFAPAHPFPAFVVGFCSVTVTARENKSKERKLLYIDGILCRIQERGGFHDLPSQRTMGDE